MNGLKIRGIQEPEELMFCVTFFTLKDEKDLILHGGHS